MAYGTHLLRFKELFLVNDIFLLHIFMTTVLNTS